MVCYYCSSHINGRLIWQHCCKYDASFSISFAATEISKYLTATGDDLNCFRKTVPNLPLPSSRGEPSASSSKEGSIFKISPDLSAICLLEMLWWQPRKINWEFLILSFSLSDALHISNYFSFIVASILNFLVRDSFPSWRPCITAVCPCFKSLFSSLFRLFLAKRCLLLLSSDCLDDFFFLKFMKYKFIHVPFDERHTWCSHSKGVSVKDGIMRYNHLTWQQLLHQDKFIHLVLWPYSPHWQALSYTSVSCWLKAANNATLLNSCCTAL